MPQAKVQPNVISYNSTIRACDKCGQWQQALKLFDAMPQAKVQPDVISYSAAISACEKGGQWQQALKLFDAMPQAKVQPDVISFNSTISACEKGSQWQHALRLFEAMSKQNVSPNLVTYNALLQSAAVHSGEIGRQLFLQCNLQVVRTLRACGSSKIDLHDLSEGTDLLALRYWLSNAVARDLESSDPLTCIIITGYGKSRKDWDTTDVRLAALNFFQRLGLNAFPFPQNP
ncbi:Pentatricopeptide repeat-containing protein At2g31400 [Durusdinium trenchii]|uniref:Chloroplastic n=1 Tax=Durusdinium trenchii TaxID=1381693 RepID=A0ABP0PQM6_9DINO